MRFLHAHLRLRRALIALPAIVTAWLLAGAGAAYAGVATTTSLSAPSQAAYGETIHLTATVRSALGTPNVGSVRFSARTGTNAAIAIGSAPVDPVSGTARLDATMPASIWVLKATYIDSTFAFDRSDSPEVLVSVAGQQIHNTTTTLSASPAAVVTGSDETLTAHVTTNDGSGIPTGVVSFTDNGVHLVDVPLDAQGYASFTRSDYRAGTHDVVASYLGVIADRLAPSSAELLLQATGSSAVKVSTTTSIQLSENAVTLGRPVTIHAHVVQTGTALPPLGGTPVTFLADGNYLGEGHLDVNGDASITIADFTLGTHTITTSYFGNEYAFGSQDADVLTVYGATVDSTLALDGAATADFADAVTLGATLTTNGGPLAGKIVTLALGLQSCAGRTDDAGHAACTVTIDQPAGSYPLTASFAGDAQAHSSTASATFAVTREQDTLSVELTRAPGSNTVVATLREDGTRPIAGRTVALTLGAQSCLVPTGSDGSASCTFPALPGVTSALLGASFGGDDYYLPAGANGGYVTLQLATTSSYTGERTADYDDPATLAATLTAGGVPVTGELVTLTMGSQSCSAATDAQGLARCTIVVAQAAGTYPLTAAFAGGGLYGASSTNTTFTVTREQATLVPALAGTTLQAPTTAITATLLEDGATPIGGRPVTIAFGGTTCTATTSAAGSATCSLPTPATLGPTAATIAFAGDATYEPAAVQATTLLYARTPGGGSFVIGDQSTAGTVTFWGAQWWKLNTLGLSAAPSAFKGYALLPAAPACGVDWSTDPGNSTPPPSAPLPAYLAVIVTSSSTKTAAPIAGTTAHVVVVRTNGDYDGNPGHAGTGTVVATVC